MALIVVLLAALYLFFGWSGEITKAEQVKDMRIEGTELIKVVPNGFYNVEVNASKM